MHDQWVGGWPALCRKDASDRLRIGRVGAEAVDSLGRKRHQAAGVKNANGLGDEVHHAIIVRSRASTNLSSPLSYLCVLASRRSIASLSWHISVTVTCFRSLSKSAYSICPASGVIAFADPHAHPMTSASGIDIPRNNPNPNP